MSLREREKCFRSILIREAMNSKRGDYRKVMDELGVSKDMIYRCVRKFAKRTDKW